MGTGAKCRTLVAASLLLIATAASAADWPERTVRVILPGGPGSSSDVLMRSIADSLSKRWGHPVVVENRPGADGFLAVQGLVESRDGHTLLFGTHSIVTVNPLLHERLPYDPPRDLLPITLAVEDFLTIVATNSLPATSVAELIQLARDRPSELNFYAVPGSPYLSSLALLKRAGVKATFVAYRSPANAMPDLLEGRIQFAVLPLAAVIGSARDGKLKLLAVTNAQRSPAASDVPTLAESGYPELTFGGLLGLFGPKEMPANVRQQISGEVRVILQDPQMAAKLSNLGLLARGTTPAEFEAILNEQRTKWAAMAREHDVQLRQ